MAPTTGPRPTTPVFRRIAILVVVALVLVISYSSSLRAWLQQRDQLAAARADISSTQQRVADLKVQRQRWHDPAYVEQQARTRFSWVLPGQVGYRVIGADGKPLGRDELSRPVSSRPSQPRTWYASVWGSVVAAGAEPARHRRQPAHPPHHVIKPGKDLLPSER